MKNERKRLMLFWLSFYSLFSAWKIIIIMLKTCLVLYIYIQLQTALGATVNNNTIQKLKQKYKRTKMTAKTGSKYIKRVTKNNIYYNKTGKFSVKAPFSIYKTTLKQLNKTAEPKADQVSYISF